MPKSSWIGTTVRIRDGMALIGGLRGKVLRVSNRTAGLAVELLEEKPGGTYCVGDTVYVDRHEVEKLQTELNL